MTTIVAATEYIDLANADIGSNITVQTTSAFYQSANSRLGIQTYSGTEDAANAYFDLPYTITADQWIHFVATAISAWQTANHWLEIFSGGTKRLGVVIGSGNTLIVQKWNGSSWSTILTSGLTPACLNTASTPGVIDIHLVVGNPGRFSMYVNGAPLVSDAALDLSFSGIAGFDKLRFQGSGASFQVVISEIIVASHNTIGSKVVSRVPDANGNYTAWTGTFADIDETTLGGGTDYIIGAADGDRESWTHTNFTALGASESISTVGMACAAQRDAAGPQSLNMFTRISSTDYDKANETINVAITHVTKFWDTNPNTSAAWTIAGLDAAEFGVRART